MEGPRPGGHRVFQLFHHSHKSYCCGRADLLPFAGGLSLGWLFLQPSCGIRHRPYTPRSLALYSFLLRQLWNPEGFQKIADVLLHDVGPLAYVTYWIPLVPKGRLRWRDTVWWSIYPLVYLALIMIRGAISGPYPYPFIHAGSLGYAPALSNAMMLFAGFLAAGLLLVAVDKLQRPKA